MPDSAEPPMHDQTASRTDAAALRGGSVTSVACFVLLLIGLHLAVGPYVRLTQWRVAAESNTNFAEALAWRKGWLDLPERTHDSALHRGRVYSVNPPLFTFLSYAALAAGARAGVPQDEFYPPWYVALLALPLPILGYGVFLTGTRRPAWAAVLTFAWIAGTAVLPCLMGARLGGICQIDHVLSQTGLLLIAGALLSHTRLWPAWLGLVIAVWSRPTTLAFAIPVMIAAWRWDPDRRMRRLLGTGVMIAGTVGVLLTINRVKFGSALDSGYVHVYEGRSDDMAQRGRRALFSLDYVAENAGWMNWSLPAWEMGSYGVRPSPNPYGTSVWFTTPLLLLAFWTIREWWRDRAQRELMLSSLLPIAAFLCYHNSGYVQTGYFRYALDFIPIWFAVIAAHIDSPGRRWFVIGATAWSALYFSMIAPLNDAQTL